MSLSLGKMAETGCEFPLSAHLALLLCTVCMCVCSVNIPNAVEDLFLSLSLSIIKKRLVVRLLAAESNSRLT